MRNTHGLRFFLRFVAGCCILPSLLILGESQIQLGPQPYEECDYGTRPANVLVEDESYGLADAQKNIFPAGYSCTWKLQDGTFTTVTTVDEGRTVRFVVALLVGAGGVALLTVAIRLALVTPRVRA